MAYADKRAAQRLETLDERFAGWHRRYPLSSSKPGASSRRSPWSDAEASRIRARALRARARDLRGGGDRALGRAPAPLVAPSPAGGCRVTVPVLAYFRGGDGFALDRAVDRARESDRGGRPARPPSAGGPAAPETYPGRDR